jgi:hypothetical protein
LPSFVITGFGPPMQRVELTDGEKCAEFGAFKTFRQ